MQETKFRTFISWAFLALIINVKVVKTNTSFLPCVFYGIHLQNSLFCYNCNRWFDLGLYYPFQGGLLKVFYAKKSVILTSVAKVKP